MRFEIVPEGFVQIFGNELKRFMCALEAYRKCANSVIPLNELIHGITDPKYASRLKNIRTKSYVLSNPSSFFMTNPDWFDEIPHYHITTIADVFNYRYWIHWEEEDSEDYLEGFSPIEDISEEHINEFKEAVRTILPECEIPVVEEEEILLSTSVSKSWDSSLKKKKPNYLIKEEKKENTFSTSHLKGTRCIIQIGPDNARDAVILPASQINSVRLIEHQCRIIADKCDYSAYTRDSAEFERRLHSLDKYYFFLNRDIKKEGITKPRQLIWAVLDVLEEKYPGYPAWKYRGIYDGYELLVDDKFISLPRGHGLGMANALTTIIQCALFQLILEEIECNESPQGRIDALFYNDDMTVGFESDVDIETYWDYEDLILSRYQIIRSDKKSHRGFQQRILCENYYAGMNDKTCYSLTELFNCFAAPNIAVAKLMFISLSAHVPEWMIESYLGELVSFWGYEFFYNEKDLPYSFGGWVAPQYLGVRLDLLYLTPDYKYEHLRALSATSVPYPKLKDRDNSAYFGPLEQKFGYDLVLPDEFSNLINYRKTKGELRSLYSSLNNESAKRNLARRYLIKRRDAFNKSHFDRYLTLTEIWEYLSKSHEFQDFYPPDSIVSDRLKVIADDEIDFSNRVVPNPILSLLKYFNRDKIDDSVIPYWKTAVNIGPQRKQLSRDEINRSQLLFNWNEKCFRLQQDYKTGVRCLEGHKQQFWDYDGVANVSFAIHSKFFIPVVECDYSTTSFFHPEDLKIESLMSSSSLRPHFLFLSRKLGSYKEAINLIERISQSLVSDPDSSEVISEYIRSKQPVIEGAFKSYEDSDEDQEEIDYGLSRLDYFNLTYFDWLSKDKPNCRNAPAYYEIYSRRAMSDYWIQFDFSRQTGESDLKEVTEVDPIDEIERLWWNQGGRVRLFKQRLTCRILYHPIEDAIPESDEDMDEGWTLFDTG